MKEWITGRNPVYEVLAAHHRDSFRVMVADGAKVEGKLTQILDLAKKYRLPVTKVSRKQLDQMGENHQGVALEAAGYNYSDIHEIIKAAQKQGEPLFVLLLDMIQNPQNLGTLVRTAAAVGMHGIIIPQAKAAGVTPAVVHASVGSTEQPKRLGGPLGIVVGNEGEGLRQLTRKACDELTALPMAGQIESLNAATAGSVMIYLAYMKRLEIL